jgi:aminoglycoside phosphotransferase (APT) family kinase protein
VTEPPPGGSTADLARALAGALGTDAGAITGLQRLSGGASRETWAFEAAGRPLILQRARPSPVRTPGMATEAALLRAAAAEGVPVPGVVATGAAAAAPNGTRATGGGDGSAGEDPGRGLGAAWMVVDRVPGETIARKILRDAEFSTARPLLAGQCGEALAGIHRIPPDAVPGLARDDQLAQLRATLDAAGEPHPAFELGFRWLDRHRPAAVGIRDSVVHGDFRNGNLVVGPDGLRAVLDWELAHRGDPLEDLGWLCVRAWRFGAEPRVGGFGSVDELVGAYEATAGEAVDRDALHWWEVLGTLKWGVICVVQAATHLTGVLRSVELAAIGRRVCEVEHDLLLVLPAGDAAARVASVGGASPPDEEAPRPPLPRLHDAPTAAQLVEAVREFLEGDVMASAEGRVRFHVRVAGRVLSQVERELAAGEGPARAHAARLAALGCASDADLAAGIRSGALDDRIPEVTGVVQTAVAAKLAVANPTYAAPEDPDDPRR